MNLFDFLLLVLATGGAVHVWFRGDIFAERRAILQAYQDSLQPGTSVVESTMYRFIELVLCPYCLSHHVAFWFTLSWRYWIAPAKLDIEDLAIVPIITLAVARTSWLLNHYLPKDMQYEPDVGNTVAPVNST